MMMMMMMMMATTTTMNVSHCDSCLTAVCGGVVEPVA
jgi:hypothetical protein